MKTLKKLGVPMDYNEKDFPKIRLTVTNMSELTKSRSSFVNINTSSFANWFTHKEESIEKSKSCVEELFIWKYACQTGKTISPEKIKTECKITRIYDKEYGQDDACLFYVYELHDTDDNPIFVKQSVQHGYGTVYDSMYLIDEKGDFVKL